MTTHCRGQAEIKLRVKFKAEGYYNGNYRSGVEELEEMAIAELLSHIPSEFDVELLDVDINDYENLEEEREEE